VEKSSWLNGICSCAPALGIATGFLDECLEAAACADAQSCGLIEAGFYRLNIR
jgi:hypothetical protein